MDASSLRKEYTSAGLDKADVDPDPIVQFHAWFEKAVEADLHEPNAMILATATTDGKPSARTVLLKGYDERGFVFYTHYEGRKARELETNPRCALLFYWGELERQVRIEGRASRLSGEESDAYFAGRPRGSRLGAWASEQSRPVEDRNVLEERVRTLEAEYEGREIPRPPFWGGYRVEPDTIEFWQGWSTRTPQLRAYLDQFERENPGTKVQDSEFADMGGRPKVVKESQDQIGFIEANTRAIFGRSYAAEPDVLIDELKGDEAIAEADAVPGAAKSGILGLARLDFLAEHEPARAHDAAEGGVELQLQLGIGGLEVEERDRVGHR